jgi:hypothetical protein
MEESKDKKAELEEITDLIYYWYGQEQTREVIETIQYLQELKSFILS